MKNPIVRVSRYWDLAATDVLNDDKLKGSDHDFTDGVLLAKDLNSTFTFWIHMNFSLSQET